MPFNSKIPRQSDVLLLSEAEGDASGEHLVAAMEEVMESLAAGKPIDRESLLAKYYDVSEELADCLENLDFIQNVAPQLNDDRPARDKNAGVAIRPLATLGDFRIVRELGRGGMGVVYEAEQLSIGRRVALKVLPFAAMLDKQQLNRFKNEARAAGTLDHPNIVAIYSVGVERSVHFYAMQLIEGESLAQAIARMRRERRMPDADRGGREGGGDATTTHHSAVPLTPSAADTQPVAALSTIPNFDDREYYRTIARLGIQAAEALDHAHQNGILHRDVKPANLMVDEAGKLWVTDFGLARLEADAGMTMTGDLIGTLRYMSPEQALAKRVVVDHRSDVYSLGATLYELLTLRPPFDGEDRQELLRQIAFDEPKRPRQLNTRNPQDLETIVMKAMEKNPARRYSTAAELAADLGRFLGNVPIQAKPLGWRGRAVKLARRHPAGVRATVFTTIASVIVLACCIGWVARDRTARRNLLLQQVNFALQESENLYSMGQVDEALSSIKRADSLLASGVGALELAETTRQRRADLEVVLRLDQFRSERAAFDGTTSDRVYREIFRDYGIDVDALTEAQTAARIRSASINQELVAALYDWSISGSFDAGLDSDRGIKSDVLEIVQRVENDPWCRRLCDALLRKDEPTLSQLAKDEQALEQPTTAIVLLGRALEAQGHYDEAVALLEKLQIRHPDDFYLNLELATCLRSVVPPRTEEAIGYRRVAVALRPNSSVAYTHLGAALWVQGRLAEAKAPYREAIRLNPGHSIAYHALVSLLLIDGEKIEAESLFLKAPKPAIDDIRAYTNYAMCLWRLGRYADAEAAYREIIVNSPTSPDAYVCLSNLLCCQRKFAEAEPIFREGVRLMPTNTEFLNSFAWLLATAADENLRNGSRAVELAVQACSQTNYENVNLLDTLAASYAEAGDFESAIKWARRAIELADDVAVTKALEQHLENFQRQEPWREP